LKTIDASTLINLFAFPQYFEKHRGLFEEELIAPAILIPEFLNGLRNLVFRKVIPRFIADSAVQKFSQLEIKLATLDSHRSEIWHMLHNFTPYDATYVLLANLTGTQLITADARLARAAQRTTEVILLE
jgi:predicted nucleic acid-binding protein